MMKLTALLLLPAVALAGGAVELTKDTFKSATGGKNAFIKFLAPWYVSQPPSHPPARRVNEEETGRRSFLTPITSLSLSLVYFFFPLLRLIR